MSTRPAKERFSAKALAVLRKAWRAQIQNCVGCRLAKAVRRRLTTPR